MPGAFQQAQHAVDAIAQAFDKAHVGQYLDHDRVARKALSDNVFDGDVAGQPSGAVDADAVAKAKDLNALSLDLIVSVGDGIDDDLAQDVLRKGGCFFSGQALQHGLLWHVGEQKRFGFADLVGQGAANVLAQKLVAHLGAGIAHGGDLGIGDPARGIGAKEQEPGVGGQELAVDLGQAGAPFQDLLRAGLAELFQPVGVLPDVFPVEVVEGDAGGHVCLKGDGAAPHHQLVNLGRLQGTVVRAVAHEIAAVGGIDVGQAGRHVYRQQGSLANRDPLGKRQHQGGGEREGVPEHALAEVVWGLERPERPQRASHPRAASRRVHWRGRSTSRSARHRCSGRRQMPVLCLDLFRSAS